ncbi:MAG: ABC transporter substrate-binding protein [Deltaproteobacteria bacterium]|jgi:peptide/nickel transport system substrate-binding protein|nr:ABC transporter substrate-binding protein [Deltaproteobacteria bacterium]
MTRQANRKRTLSGFALLCLLGVSFFCAPPQVLQADVLRLAYPVQPKSLDPHQYPPDPASWPIVMTCYRRLFDLKAGTSEIEAVDSAAATYRVSDDGLVYTIILQEGRTFTDGTPVDSQAVLFSFDRLMATQTGKQHFPYLKYMEIVGPYTFRFRLTRPWPPFLASLTLPMASLVSPGVTARGSGFLNRGTAGSGRFEVEEYKPNQINLRIRLDAPSAPKLDRAEFLYEPDPTARADLVASGRAHLAFDALAGNLSPSAPAPKPRRDEAAAALEALPPTYVQLMVPGFQTRFLAFNMTRPYLKMIGVREAIAGLARIALLSPYQEGRPGLVLPTGLAPTTGALEETPLDRAEETAGELLAQLGPSRIPLDLAYFSDDQNGRADAELLAQKLSAYGLSARLVPLTGAHGQGLLEKADWDLLLAFRQPDIPSPEMWLGRFLDSRASVASNPARFSSPQADGLIAELDAVDRRAREMSLRRLALLAMDQKPYVMLYQKMTPVLADVRLQGLRPHPMWPYVWPVDETNLDPFRGFSRPAPPPPPASEPLFKDFDDPVAEPYE